MTPEAPVGGPDEKLTTLRLRTWPHMDQHLNRLDDGAPPRGVPRDVRGLAAAGPSAPETWLRIVQVHDRVTRRVDSALHRQHGLSLTGFEVLRRIAESPGERASMGDLAEAV